MVTPKVSFRLAKSVVASSKATSAAATIPAGSVVEIPHPAIGDLIEVEWDAGVYSVSLSALLQACRDQAPDR